MVKLYKGKQNVILYIILVVTMATATERVHLN